MCYSQIYPFFSKPQKFMLFLLKQTNQSNTMTLKKLSILAAGVFLTLAACTKEKPKTVGIQLYSVMSAMQENPTATLERLASQGYNACELVQWGGDEKVFGMDPAAFRNVCDSLGISIISTHSGIQEDPENPAEVEKKWRQLFDIQSRLGGKYFIVPSYGYENTTEGVKKMADYFNRVGAIANEYGLKLGYHNHWAEFKPLENDSTSTMYDEFVALTDPDKVCMELDVYWAQKAGRNPVELMAQYPDRIQILHIKDNFTIGESGTIDFEKIFNQHYANGHTDYVVEIETPAELREKTKEDGSKLSSDEIMEEVFQSAADSYNYLNNATFTK